MKINLFAIFLLAVAVLAACKKDDDKGAGLTVATTTDSQFTPLMLEAKVGDVITFHLGAGHTATRVDEVTWNANAATPVTGFDLTAGTGTYTVQASDVGVMYYVCKSHVASMGMKGMIMVSDH